jgi:5'-3' exonuclease
VDVVSGDRDLVQLVDDEAGVRLLYIGRGVRNLEVLEDATVRTKYGIPGRAYADMAAMRGDPSDGLPGVPGIGEKTAASLLQRWGSVEELISAVDADDPSLGQRAKLAAARDYLLAAVAVTRVRRDCPLPPYDDVLPAQPRDPERLVDLADRWGVESSVNRMLNAMRAAATE